MTDAAAELPEIHGWSAGTWAIDPDHSQVGFSVRHLMGKVHGRFTEFEGRLVTTEDPAHSSVTAEIALASIDTASEMRDNHLRSADFFDVAATPTMRFISSGIRQAGDSWVIAGKLTIRENTEPVEIDVEFLGVDPDGLQGETRIGFTGKNSISRREFGVGFGLWDDGRKIVVGDRVDIVLDVQAVLEI